MDDELAEIREQKRAELAERAEGESAETPTEPIHVEGDDHLGDLVDDHDVVLVDFYADWCGPCKMLAPTVETLAAETDAAVAKVDVDAHQHLAAEYQVRGVPTIVLFADGQPVERFSGVRGKDELRSLIANYT